MLWMVHESGYPKESLRFSFCDTGNEHQLTYDHVRMLSETVWPIETIKPPLDFYALARHKKRFPSARARFCTEELKVNPTKHHVSSLVALGNDVVMHSGVRANESDSRAKLVSREDVRESVSEFRPLLKWSISEVWSIHHRYGVSANPLYAMGARRVGCLPCVMSRKAEIALISKISPETINRIRSAEGHWCEEGVEHVHTFFARDKVPMRFRSKKVKTADGRKMVVPLIDDVVRWATEVPDYIQMGLPMEERTEQRADKTACDSTLGYCE